MNKCNSLKNNGKLTKILQQVKVNQLFGSLLYDFNVLKLSWEYNRNYNPGLNILKTHIYWLDSKRLTII